MIITFRNNTIIEVSDETAVKLDRLWGGKAPDRVVKVDNIKGLECTIVLSTISGIYPNELWDEMQHEKVGDVLCKWGTWHPKGERCMHTDPLRDPIDFGALNDPANITGTRKEYREKWFKILGLNATRVKHMKEFNSDKLGLIKTFAELEHYEKTSEFPEYVDPTQWPKVGFNGLVLV